LVVDLLVAKIALDADARLAKLRCKVTRIIVGVGYDRGNHRLDWREPGRKAACEMLDQDSDEALVTTEDRAVEHDRAVALAILADVACVETLGENPVGLDGSHLPGATDRVSEMPFELGRIKGA